jgi:hypothetical protein
VCDKIDKTEQDIWNLDISYKLRQNANFCIFPKEEESNMLRRMEGIRRISSNGIIISVRFMDACVCVCVSHVYFNQQINQER